VIAVVVIGGQTSPSCSRFSRRPSSIRCWTTWASRSGRGNLQSVDVFDGITEIGRFEWKRPGSPMEPSKIVARYRDGRTVKGTSQTFSPTNRSFTSIAWEEGSRRRHRGEGRGPESDLLRTGFHWEPEACRKKQLGPEERAQGRLMEVTCKDGEVFVGRRPATTRSVPAFSCSRSTRLPTTRGSSF